MNLENWEKKVAHGGMHIDPTISGGIISGVVFGHPTVADGERIETCTILGWDFRDRCFVDAAGLEYRLKTPHPDYETRFPGSNGKIEKAVENRKHMMPPSMYAKRANL